MRFTQTIKYALCAAAATSLTLTVANHSARAQQQNDPSPYAWFDPIIDVETLIARRFVTEPDLQAVQLAAIEGMIEALGDRYTQYIPPENKTDFDKAIRGRYVGIGASVRIEEGVMTIVSPLEDSPAYHAGISAGDRIVAIDGIPTLGDTIDDSIKRLTGIPGTDVVVTIERNEEEFDVTIKRAQIRTRTVHGFHRQNGDGWDFMIDPTNKIGYIRLSQFTAISAREMRNALDTLTEQRVQGIVFDLRFNPGGLLTAASQIADMFLPGGLIVSTKGRAFEEDTVYATPENTIADLPLVVLLNRESASASEVVSGALRDNDRAIVIGTRSFGKGSVQSVIPLPSGLGELKLTEQHYYGPSGKMIHRTDDSTEWGVDPTPGFFVPMTDEEYREMLAIRREREIITNDNNPTLGNPDEEIAALQDKQLTAAINAIRTKLETNEWEPLAGEDDHATVEIAELRRLQLGRDRLLRELQRVDRRIDAASDGVPDDREARAALVPEDAELDGGHLELYDAEGNLVATLEITDEGFERWLVDAPVRAPDDNGDSQ